VVDRLRSVRGAAARFPVDASSQLMENQPETRSIEPMDQTAGAEETARLRTALNTLSADQQKALEMAYFDAMSYAEVAESLGQPLGTVKSRIRQALIQLRQLLGKAEP
jgi:RNA polymerase sigma-70 factor (ECF subfamily)